MIAPRRGDILAQVGSRWPRHTLLWPAATERVRMRAEAREESGRAAVDLWFTRDWPFVVRRNDHGAISTSAEIAIGLPLPPSCGKTRLAFHVPGTSVARFAPPLALGVVARAIPHAWQRPLVALDETTRKAGISLSVFGSAAWQAITGLAYLHADSDLDVLFRPANVDEIDVAAALFERWEHSAHRRIDGEILFPGDVAVAWREWVYAERGACVLAKNVDDVALIERSILQARLAAAPMVAACT